MKKLFAPLSLAFAILAVNSCRRDNYQVICYGNDIQPIFNRMCANIGCHSSGSHAAGYDLTSYDGVMKAVVAGKSGKSALYDAIKGSHPEMPQTGQKLSKKEVAKIKSWIDFGAQDCANTVISGCDTTNVTYGTHIKPLMEGFCVSCHFTGNATAYTLDNYNGVVAAVNSTKLIPSVKFTGDPMPQGGQKLSDCNIIKIEKWIAAGMPQ
jgi:predicted CxxxxCH...CXXCH cytochrome family protein